MSIKLSEGKTFYKTADKFVSRTKATNTSADIKVPHLGRINVTN